MKLLILGLLIWSGVHFIPSLALPLKNKWKNLLGDKGYQISFSLITVLSLVLIVLGWRSISPTQLYSLPEITRLIALVLMIVAFVLFAASHHRTRIKQFVRHPQLTGLIVWSFAHLLVNGDNRSVVLFGGMAIWAISEIIIINRREGIWKKAGIPTWAVEIKGTVISLAIFVAVALAHPYLSGVSLR